MFGAFLLNYFLHFVTEKLFLCVKENFIKTTRKLNSVQRVITEEMRNKKILVRDLTENSLFFTEKNPHFFAEYQCLNVSVISNKVC